MPVVDTTGWASFNTNTGGSGDITLSALVVDTEPTEAVRALYYMEALGGLLWEYGTCALLDNELTEREVISSSSGRSRVIFPKSGVTVKLAPPVEEVVLGGGITNGDKGDVTVAGGGASLTVNAGAVDVAHLSTDFSAAMKALLAGTAAAEDNATALGFGSAALESASAFATAGHVHDSPADVGILGVASATVGQIPIVNADGVLAVRTATIADFASAAFTGASRTVIVRSVDGLSWEKKTLQEFLSLVGKDKVAIPFAIPESDGEFPICPYVPQGAVGTVSACYAITIAGTQRLAVKIGGTDITGVSAVDISTTRVAATATAANSLTLGAQVTGSVSLSTGASKGMGILLVTTAVP